MTPSEALHTAVRRYCRDNFIAATLEYRQRALAAIKDGKPCDPPVRYASDCMPCAWVLKLVLYEVERLVPSRTPNLQNFRTKLKAAVAAGCNHPMAAVGDPNQLPYIQEIQQEVETFIASQHMAQLERVQPLPYLRVLTIQEGRSLKDRLRAQWQFEQDWFPRSGKEIPDGVLIFSGQYTEEMLLDPLRQILSQAPYPRFFELGSEVDLEIEAESFYASVRVGALGDNILYDHWEAYWTPADLSWLIYASHDDTITIGGPALIKELTALVPDCLSQQIEWPWLPSRH